MKIGWVAPVKPSHPYLENDPAPLFDLHYLRISPWLWFRLMIISSFTGRSCLRKVSGAAFPRANVSAGVSARSCGSWPSSPASCSSSPAVSARFPRDVTGSPASALGTGCSPGNPLCAGAESPKSAPQRASGSPVQPCGLVCEVMACRSGRSGLVGLGLCSAFPARPQYRYTVFRLTPRSLEISAALTSLSRSSWLAQGPVTADLTLADPRRLRFPEP